MDQAIRNKLRNVVTQCRKLLEESIAQTLQGQFGIHLGKKGEVQIEDESRLSHLSEEDRAYRKDILDHFEHIKARGHKAKDALDQLIREIAFTHLNRLCAYKMMEAREVYVSGQKFREAVSRGINSNGFKFYLADHPDDERLFDTGRQDVAYRHFLDWIGGLLSEEIGVLFNPNDPANRLYPPQRVLNQVLDLLNGVDIKPEDTELRAAWPKIWSVDETIGWVYQYFTPKELRDQARKESAAPRNAYELAFRNQFYTPRYVVEFLTDNTLGRIWYEMRKGDTKLKDQCRYMVRRPDEIFLNRPKKDPRDLKILDPACGSGHFLLYCFDLLQTIYEEAYDDTDLGPVLKKDYPTIDDLRRAVPGLILSRNLHGIDIDLRSTQIAALALWLRCQRAFLEMGLQKNRPKITRSNIVCAEPMPGEKAMRGEFISNLRPRVVGELVEKIFDKMTLAGEAGSLLKIEQDLRDAVALARKQWLEGPQVEQLTLFDVEKPQARQLTFDLSGITDQKFWDEAEAKVIASLRAYATRVSNGRGLQRQLFADDTAQGFAFIDLCRKRFDVVLMNPPFGDASLPSKPYIEDVYADTKGDVYKAFVECFQDRLVPGGMLGIISSRTGFFLGQSTDWRERIVLRLFRPLALADFGQGVLDAMVETAAYVLRSLDDHEDYQLTLRLLPELQSVPTDSNGYFSIPKYQRQREGLKRHQAEGELGRLLCAGFIKEIPGHYRRFRLEPKAVRHAPPPEPESFEDLICFRLTTEQNKGMALCTAIESLGIGQSPTNTFIVQPASFRKVTGSPFAYWVRECIRKLFTELPPFEKDGREARRGASTGDDSRRVRTSWEVSPSEVGRTKRWVPLSKGGSYSPYYADIHLLVGWDESRQTFEGFYGRPGRMIERPEALGYFFRPGLTWPRRTTSGISIRILPAGCIFSDKAPSAFIENPFVWQGLLQSSVFGALIELQLAAADAAARSYEVGLIQRTPVPNLSSPKGEQLGSLAFLCMTLKRDLDRINETSHVFHLPALLQAPGQTLAERIAAWQAHFTDAEQKLAEYQREIDGIAFQLYGIEGEDRQAIEHDLGDQKPEVEEENDADEQTEVETTAHDERSLIAELLSYTVGCAFGRWDLRFATDERARPELPDPFAPLPVCSPGMLQGPDGLPAIETPVDYLLRINWDGILPDDPDHPDDVIRCVRDVLELIWKDRAEAIEKEACEILGVKALRDYFRKPGSGGFWNDHVKRYSKSRRKAPIYWLLQSSKKNYVLWLYYHRLDKDILFKALLNYVEPKIRLEQNRLDSLRSQRSAAGQTGKEARKLDREIERQDDLLSELRDFEEKLRRAADLHLEPDLNDGVVLNIAPLWELVPWKEARKYWEELLEGKYGWSSIGKQLQEKRLVK